MKRQKSIKDQENKIVIDEAKGLLFDSEEELFEHFAKEIKQLEDEFFALRGETDIPEEDIDRYEDNLNVLLEEPDEIWRDKQTLKGIDLAVYIKRFADDDEDSPSGHVYHIAVVYLTKNIPTFVYLHFPTNSELLVQKYRRGDKVFDQSFVSEYKGAIEGDALYEGDEFAAGLYAVMLKLRAESDIKEVDFPEFADLREESIEHPDEIWRSNDSMGNILVTFVREFHEELEGDQSVFYLVVTLEDQASSSHALLFSFPTNDESLVARYRHGENLQAEEVTQEASH